MHDLFTRGVLPNGQLRPPREQAPELYQETAIGWIPREWEISDCATEFAIDSGITLGPHRKPDKRPHPYLRVANVHRDELRLDDVAQMEVSASEIEFALKKHDLLVIEGHASRSEIGRCAMVGDDAEGMLFQNHLIRLRPSRMESHYALLCMNSHYAQRYWEVTCSSSSGLNTINRRMLGRLTVFVPPITEQQKIVAKALSVRQMLHSERTKVQKLQTQKLGLMQDLLTGKVAVSASEE
jgi:type I restriction enzyme, S subunit